MSWNLYFKVILVHFKILKLTFTLIKLRIWPALNNFRSRGPNGRIVYYHTFWPNGLQSLYTKHCWPLLRPYYLENSQTQFWRGRQSGQQYMVYNDNLVIKWLNLKFWLWARRVTDFNTQLNSWRPVSCSYSCSSSSSSPSSSPSCSMNYSFINF